MSNMASNYGADPGNSTTSTHHSHPNSNPAVANSNPSGTYGNTHSSTGTQNPIHPSSTQSTANPLYGKSNVGEVPYETSGGNSSQGYGGGAYNNESADATTGGPGAYETGGANSGNATGSYDAAGVGSNGNETVTGGRGTNMSTGEKVRQGASGLKGLAATVHGAGEAIRGKFNSSVDQAFNEPTGVAKNNAIAQQGAGEMDTGRFSHATKNREGVVPGDHEARSTQPL